MDTPTKNTLDIEVIGASVNTPFYLVRLLNKKRGALFVLGESTLSAGGHSLVNDILDSANYFLFTTREKLPSITYGVQDVFRLETNGIRRKMVPCYVDLPKTHNISGFQLL